MASSVPTSANDFIEQQLNERLANLENAFESDGLCFFGPIYPGVDDLIRTAVEDLQRRDGEHAQIAFLLTTTGGMIEVVQRIVETIRHHYSHVRFIVPDYAFSAGTVLAMSGDEIFMDYYSRLGPIDPQVQNIRGRWVPALGYLVKWQELIEKAQNGTLTLAEAQLMIDGFDQAELYQYEQARELSVTLLKEWLVKYKFKNWHETETNHTKVTLQMRQRRAEDIARELNNTDRWHSHGYGISLEVLRRDLKLLVDDLEDSPERCDQVKQYHGLLSDYLAKRGNGGVVHTVDRYLPFA